jgi:hypothetical protein
MSLNGIAIVVNNFTQSVETARVNANGIPHGRMPTYRFMREAIQARNLAFPNLHPSKCPAIRTLSKCDGVKKADVDAAKEKKAVAKEKKRVADELQMEAAKKEKKAVAKEKKRVADELQMEAAKKQKKQVADDSKMAAELQEKERRVSARRSNQTDFFPMQRGGSAADWGRESIEMYIGRSEGGVTLERAKE